MINYKFIVPNQEARRLWKEMPHLVQTNRTALKKALHIMGMEIKREIKRIIRTGPRTGIMYGLHQASAPGEPPANRTGKLAKSAYFRVRNWHYLEVGDHAPYSGYLEEGTPNMKPRPYMAVAVRNKGQEFVNEIELSVSREINN